ncbi:MAG TPA: ABC transporter permease [Flavipsychrobacter sp.]|nr:ABC transporter permease [Flavipsychrobacter sp.]
MNSTAQIIVTSVTQALQELRVNKLRTFLSLLGITIGIFCIIAVLTVLDSLQDNIRKSMATLGNDVIYVNRRPWIAENGEYKWWEYLQRPPMSTTELKAIQRNVGGVQYATLCYVDANLTLKSQDNELKNVAGYGVTANFDKIQNVEIQDGRYLSQSEIDGGVNSVVVGHDIYENLFSGHVTAVNKTIAFLGRKFLVVGVMKKVGKNMAGFDFDNAIIFSYNSVNSLVDTRSMDWGNDPIILVKVLPKANLEDAKLEIEGALRVVRKMRPGEKDNFAINQLSEVSQSLNAIFGTIDVIGLVIGGFSLLVGSFGIANIMFVTVKERTKIIGLKKAIGARRRSIMTEFLIEAVTLCILGGLIGIIIVLLLSLLMTYGLDFAVTLSLKNFLFGIGISALVGILAGIIPARSASRLDPVVAIRSN